MESVAVGLFVVAFAAVAVRQVVGRGPGIWAILLVAGAATVALGVLPPTAALSTLVGERSVLLFLFALFVFVAALERSGVFEHLAYAGLSRVRERSSLPFLFFVGFGIVSAFVLNDALVLVGVPLVFAVARRLDTDARPYLLVLAYAVTVGSVATPIGNPQNLLVGLDAGFADPAGVFVRYLAVPTAINLVVGGLYLRAASRPPGAAAPNAPIAFPPVPFLPPGGWGRRLSRHPVLAIFPATIAAVVGVDLYSGVTGVAGIPSYEIALLGAALLLLLSPGRTAMLRRVDWSVLLLFVGLFVVVAGAVAGGLLSGVERLLPIPGPSAPPLASIGSITVTSLLGSQLVSNVPWVALQIPLFHALGYGAHAPVAWMALAAGSTLAGNLTLLGAASNLIVVEQARRRGISIRLGEFVRRGLPLAAITTGILLVCLWAGI